ncbi:MAG TPA: efflux RND transporter periplasmic adaptor subunit [Kofleriaceae bacterium]
MMSRTSTYLLVTTSLVLGSCKEEKKVPPPPPPAQVGFVTVEKRDVALYIEAVGSVDGYVNTDIRARVRGYLEKQLYKDGAKVTAGQPLFTVEATEYQAATQSANASVSRAKVALAKSKIDRERAQNLLKAGMASQQDVDNTSAASADAEAQVNAAQAQLQTAGLNLSYTQIKSPITGVAGLALVRIGNLVGQDGPTLLTTVSQLDPVRVNFPLSEIDYVKYPARFANLEGRDLAWAQKEFVKLDQDPKAPGVEIVLADGSVYKHRGTLVTVNRQIDPTSGTTTLQALVPNPDGILRPGEYAKVRIRRENEGQNVLVVPEKALISVQGSYSVAVIGDGNKIQMKKVDLGPSSQGMRVVTQGLQGGEEIVLEGVQRVQDGATVMPHPAGQGGPGAGSGAGAGAGSSAGSGSGSGSGSSAGSNAPDAVHPGQAAGTAGSGSGSAAPGKGN